MTTPRPGADWRIIAEQLRAAPGVWLSIPEGWPLLNRNRVRRGKVKAFAPAGAFEVRGTKHGQQRARFVGDADAMLFYTRVYPSLAALPRTVAMPAWRDHGLERPGFTTLPAHAETPPVVELVEWEAGR